MAGLVPAIHVFVLTDVGVSIGPNAAGSSPGPIAPTSDQ
jgi:hypothetical protein